MSMLAIVIKQKKKVTRKLTKGGRMNSKEGEMSNLQMKEKLSHSPGTHDLSIQKIVLWNMQMKFPTF